VSWILCDTMRKGGTFVGLELHTFCYPGRCPKPVRLEETSIPSLALECIIPDTNRYMKIDIPKMILSFHEQSFLDFIVFQTNLKLTRKRKNVSTIYKLIKRYCPYVLFLIITFLNILQLLLNPV
jgi:hypothetical protein